MRMSEKFVKSRCPWTKSMLILEGMQAGVSWNIILKKRKAFQEELFADNKIYGRR